MILASSSRLDQRLFEGDGHPPQLAVELRDLPAQVRHVAARGEVHQMPQPLAAPLQVAAHACLGARREAEPLEEGVAAHRALEPGAHGLLCLVEHPPQQRLDGHMPASTRKPAARSPACRYEPDVPHGCAGSRVGRS
jgi:hypothetical protein